MFFRLISAIMDDDVSVRTCAEQVLLTLRTVSLFQLSVQSR